jgi:ribonuclease VapC
MVVDTSAILCIFWEQEGHQRYREAIEAAPAAVMSAVALYESCVVVYADSRRDADVTDLVELIRYLDISILPFEEADALAAARTYQKYGKGIHRAGLNLGDCPSYALASVNRSSLLYKGNDFSETDIQSALN